MLMNQLIRSSFVSLSYFVVDVFVQPAAESEMPIHRSSSADDIIDLPLWWRVTTLLRRFASGLDSFTPQMQM